MTDSTTGPSSVSPDLAAHLIAPLRYGGRMEYMFDSLWVAFDQIHLGSEGLKAWVEVRWTANMPRPRMLTFGTYNLMGARTVNSLASAVTAHMPNGGMNPEVVKAKLTAAVYDVVQEHLHGQPPERLDQVEVAEGTDERWILYPLIGATGATSLIAPGGSTKSYLALAAALSVASGRAKFLSLKPRVVGPVLLLDWEADARTHAERMRALCAPYGIDPPEDLYYRAEKSPLRRSAASLSKMVDELGIVLVIVDSVMLARGGDAYGAEETTLFYGALRELERPALLIDHKSREAVRKGWTGAYGSVVNDNTARLQWEINSVEDQGPDDLAIKLVQAKRNNVGKLSPLAFEIHFENGERSLEGVTFRAIDPATVEGFGQRKDNAADRILSELKLAGEEGMTAQELAATTGKTDNQIRARLNELLRMRQVEQRKVPGSRSNRWYAAGWDQQEKVDAYPDPF